MAKWTGCQTQDQYYCGSIPNVGHVEKCQANIKFHTAFVYPAIILPGAQIQCWLKS